MEENEEDIIKYHKMKRKKRKIRLAIASVSLIVVALFLIILYTKLNRQEFIIYKENSDINYVVNLKKNDFYEHINNLSFKNYAEKYLLGESGGNLEDLTYDTSLFAIANYLKTNNNYKIYHSIDDFLINSKQLERLKMYSPQNVVCLNNGSHLGFLYRDEFINELKKEISLNKAVS